MSISKRRISSPLEAGRSLLDTSDTLPAELIDVLNYISQRLARKQLHLTLVVVPKETPIPSLQVTHARTGGRQRSASISAMHVPSLYDISASVSASVAAFSLSLVRSRRKVSSSSSPSSSPVTWSSSTLPLASPSMPHSSPTSQQSLPLFQSLSSSSSPFLSTCPAPSETKEPEARHNPWGITLVHATSLSEKAAKILRKIIENAKNRFSIDSLWLTFQFTCSNTSTLLHASLKQNHVLYKMAGLTLLSLDQLYIFKCALHTHSTSLTAASLTTAVDELQRLILLRRITTHNLSKAAVSNVSTRELLSTYCWQVVNLSALVDVNEAFKIAYGGSKRNRGVDLQSIYHYRNKNSHETARRGTGLTIKTDFETEEIRKMHLSTSFHCDDGNEFLPTPLLSISTSSSLSSSSSSALDDEHEHGNRPTIEEIWDEKDQFAEFEAGKSAWGRDSSGFAPWGSAAGAHNCEGLCKEWREDRGPHRRGPRTPNGCGDITPITEGEWRFLTVGDGWTRRGGVETCY